MRLCLVSAESIAILLHGRENASSSTSVRPVYKMSCWESNQKVPPGDSPAPGLALKPTMNSKLGNIVSAAFTPVLVKHSKSFSLIDCISVGVDRMQRNFEPMRRQVEAWQRSELTDVTAKVVIYEAFIEGQLEAPKHLARSVHDLYFDRTTRIFVPARPGDFLL